MLEKLLGTLNQSITYSKEFKGTIAITFVSLLVYYVNEKLKPPKYLRHIPVHFSIFDTVKALLITKETLVEQKENQVMAYINNPDPHEVYLTLTGLGWFVRVASPEITKKVIKLEKYHNSAKGSEHLLIMRFLSGPNLLQETGKEWRHQRMIANPAFHRNMPVKLFGRLSQDVFRLIDKSPNLQVNVSVLVKRYALEAIGKAGFGFGFDALEDHPNKWISIYEEINQGFLDPKFYILPFFETKFGLNFFPKRKEIHRKLDEFLAMLDDVIEAKREKLAKGDIQNEDLEENEKDILTLMIENESEEEDGLTNEQLKSNLCVFFFAGHDTTASAIASLVYYLAVDPEIQTKARQEAISVLGDEPSDVLPTISETKNFPYIDQIIKETLRISPPVMELSPRVLLEDYNTGSLVIPKGAIVQIDNYAVQHNQRVWENPYKFDPDRFSGQTDPSKWVPFGGGPRICIGMNFSINEQRVLLAMLLRKYTWTLPEDSIHKNGLVFEGAVTMAPKELHIQFQRRY